MGQSIRLLIVDDDIGFRETLRALLARQAEAVIVGEAADGEEAVRLAERLAPDLVLMDLAMPRLNGLEALRRIRARRPDLAVILLTVHDEEVYRRTALAAGAAAFLEKRRLGVELRPTLLRILEGSAPATPGDP